MIAVIAYDVRNDDRRAQMAALLGSYGVRIQRSVFECQLDAEALASVVRRAESLLDLDHDVFHVIPQCGTCWESRVALGQTTSVLGDLYWVV